MTDKNPTHEEMLEIAEQREKENQEKEKQEKKTPKKRTSKKQTTTKQTPKKEETKVEFPYSMFPFVVIHKDGKDLKDTKKCYFQSMSHVDKYIARNKFKQKDYQLFVKPGTDVETLVQSTGRKSRKK